jgi:hypothetical protein
MARTQTIGASYDAYEDLIVSDEVVGFTAGTVGKNRDRAFITVEDGEIRYRVDGGDPGADSGHLLEPGDTLILDNQVQLQRVRFLAQGEIPATLRCSYGG